GDLTALNPLDVLTTLTELTAVSIRNAVQHYGHRHGELLICGGGIHNHYLLQRLQALLPALRIGSTADYGVAPDWLEAMAFGWLAARTLKQLSGNAPDATGASGEISLGGIFPACRPDRSAGSDRKRRTTTTGWTGSRVGNHKTRSFQPFFIVQYRADQIAITQHIDQHPHAIELNQRIVFGTLIIEGKTVLKPGAAATG